MTMVADKRIEMVDALLPQTQCGLCGFEEGCKPYATAMVTDGEPINQCVPGGQPVADALADFLNKTKEKVVPSKWAVASNGRPQEMRAVIIEEDCIGCTKCISACPVDAIVGSGKLMHTVFTDLCTGCELCLPPCPVDCIDLVPIHRELTDEQRQAEQNDLRTRYESHLNRLTQQITAKENQSPVVNSKMAKITQKNITVNAISQDDAKKSIEAAKLRSQIKRLQKQLSVRENLQKQAELNRLNEALAKLEDQTA